MLSAYSTCTGTRMNASGDLRPLFLFIVVSYQERFWNPCGQSSTLFHRLPVPPLSPIVLNFWTTMQLTVITERCWELVCLGPTITSASSSLTTFAQSVPLAACTT